MRQRESAAPDVPDVGNLVRQFHDSHSADVSYSLASAWFFSVDSGTSKSNQTVQVLSDQCAERYGTPTFRLVTQRLPTGAPRYVMALETFDLCMIGVIQLDGECRSGCPTDKMEAFHCMRPPLGCWSRSTKWLLRGRVKQNKGQLLSRRRL